jgi:hypothetical protein
MEILVEISIDTRSGVMSDRIDKLKSDRDHQAQHDQLGLNEDAAIEALMPSFWNQLRTCLATDITKLRQEFHDDLKYHCSIDPSTNPLVLTNSINPRIRLTMEFSTAGRFVDIVERRQDGPLDSSREAPRSA